MKLSTCIQEMQQKKQKNIQQNAEIDKCISFLQEHCDHQYDWIANTHNDDIHQCIHCLHEMRI